MNAPLKCSRMYRLNMKEVEEIQTTGCCEAGGKVILEMSELAAENDEAAGASYGLNKFLQAEE